MYPATEMVSSVSPFNKKEPNGIQETNIRPIKPVVVVVIVVRVTVFLQTVTQDCKATLQVKQNPLFGIHTLSR